MSKGWDYDWNLLYKHMKNLNNLKDRKKWNLITKPSIRRNFMPELMWFSVLVKLRKASWSDSHCWNNQGQDGCSGKDVLTVKEKCVLDLDAHYKGTTAFSLMERIRSMKLLTTMREQDPFLL